MQSFFWHVLDDQRVYNSVLREIEQAVTTGVLPAEGNVTWNQAQSLPYLQACLKEAMRVRPAVGLNITRVVPPEGAELDGHFFPGGTTIACNGWVLHRDKEVFGQDADDYRPERWLEDEERAKRMERYMFQVSTLLPLPRAWMCLTIRSIVRWWKPSVHWPQPGTPRNQQGRAEVAARLSLRASTSRAAAKGKRLVLRGPVWSGGTD